MFEVDKLSSFFTKLSKITLGHHGGHLMPPDATPHPTTNPTPPPTHPWRKIGALMPDISWALPHSLPIK